MGLEEGLAEMMVTQLRCAQKEGDVGIEFRLNHYGPALDRDSFKSCVMRQVSMADRWRVYFEDLESELCIKVFRFETAENAHRHDMAGLRLKAKREATCTQSS